MSQVPDDDGAAPENGNGNGINAINEHLTKPEGFGRGNRSKDHGEAAELELMKKPEYLAGVVRQVAVRVEDLNERWNNAEEKVEERDKKTANIERIVGGLKTSLGLVLTEASTARRVAEQVAGDTAAIRTRVWMLEIMRSATPLAYVLLAAVVGSITGSGVMAFVWWRMLARK